MISSLDQPLLSTEWWNEYFREGGCWEKNRGRLQTRLFAEAFCRHTRVNRSSRCTLLDSSCALGDAMPVLKRFFPNATLYGLDFSEVAIRRCRRRFSHLATFSVSSIKQINGMYDIIYSSSTLEHFVDFRRVTRAMLEHCRYLCIVVPYNEQRDGKDLVYAPDRHHVQTFREHTFDFLSEEKLALRILKPHIFRVPVAWSWTLEQRAVQTLKNVRRLILGRPLARDRQMILFEIVSKFR